MSVIDIGKVGDIPSGTMKAFPADGKMILIANINGKYYAIDNTCTHAGGNLSKGKLEGTIVTCPRHGSRFDVTTGKSISGPKIGLFRFKTRDTTTYQVKLEGDNLRVVI